MMEILCECDWDIGLHTPHSHRRLRQVPCVGGTFIWMHDYKNSPDAVLEVQIYVDWKALAKELLCQSS